ncbi:hypothetical protein EBU71_03250 [bacterium]|nr:hypothetical protein [Candidatus Elulimicrobium humile]
MSLFGNKDVKAITGTVAVSNGSATVTGTGTAFLTELKPGNTLFIVSSGNTQEYRVLKITSNTSLTLEGNFGGITQTGITITANEQPAYIPLADLESVYGVSAAEAAVTSNKAKGINTAGWVKYNTYTDAQGATRHKAETLVAMGTITGDAGDDSVVADA